MKLKRTAAVGVAIVALLAGAHMLPAAESGTSPAVSAGEAPAIVLPQKSFEFQPVIDGAKVEHDFAVLNKGAAPLRIENVKTG
jgi:hypothetical protein